MRPVVGHYLYVAVGLINIPIKVGKRAWCRCFGLMLRQTDIFGVNESLTVRQRRLYRQIAREKGWAWAGSTGPNPVFWNRRKYHLISARRVRLHPAGTSRRARLFPGYNAAREVTEVVLGVNGHPGTEVAILCWHGVPGGIRVPRAWRDEMRALTKARIAWLTDKHLGAGRIVFSVADTNIFRAFALGAIRWLRGRGVDKVGVAVPRNVQITAPRAYTFRAPTDHRHGVVGVVRLIVNPRS